MLRSSFVLTLTLMTSATFAQPGASPEELANNFKTALARKDAKGFEAMLAVAAERDRGPVTDMFRRRAQLRLVSAELVPFAKYESSYKAAVARGLKPAVEPVAWLVVKYTPQTLDGSGATSTETDVYLVGKKDGKYMLSS